METTKTVFESIDQRVEFFDHPLATQVSFATVLNWFSSFELRNRHRSSINRDNLLHRIISFGVAGKPSAMGEYFEENSNLHRLWNGFPEKLMLQLGASLNRAVPNLVTSIIGP